MNTRVRSIVFMVSAILTLSGLVLYLAHLFIAPYLFAVGSAGIAICYLSVPVRDMGFRQRRLHRYNVIAGLLMIFASGLMFANRKEWALSLAIAAFMQLYTAFINPKKN